MAILKTYFLNTIKHLRLEEELVLYANIPAINEDEENLAIQYLEQEYNNECTNYPHEPPAFDSQAALWAAKTIYYAAQLLLYRENRNTELEIILPAYPIEPNASAILSIDISLRFLPYILENIKAIDPEDAIIQILENHLYQWHYSAFGFKLNRDKLNFDGILNNGCLTQLYVNRIIDSKTKALAELPFLKNHVKACLGNFRSYFWHEL